MCGKLYCRLLFPTFLSKPIYGESEEIQTSLQKHQAVSIDRVSRKLIKVLFKENSKGLTDGSLEPSEAFENVLSAEMG